MMNSLQIPFGAAGLDRSSGVMAVRNGTLRDARNVYVRSGKATLRGGSEVTASLPDQGGYPCTHISLLEAVQFERAGIVVGFYADSGALHLYRLTGSGGSPTHIGLLYNLPDGAQSPPRLHAAEVGGQVFIAHDEPLQSKRAPTFVYDPLGSTTLYALTASLNDAGVAPVLFRGVLSWSDYLVGWGFSVATEARPEVIRVSLPGRPTEFDPLHYFVAGARGDPVLSCRPAGGVLLAMKASQTYRIIGTSQVDFGILPLHALTGALSHSLTIELDGRCFAWSAEGPVVMTGAVEPNRLEEPLDLSGPQPSSFAGLDYTDGYCQYIPGRRVLEWVYGEESFNFDLVSKEWSYGVSGFSRSTGALLYVGNSLADELDLAPTGYPKTVVVTPHATEVKVQWTNFGAVGNETVEVWLQAEGEEWYLAGQLATTLAATQSLSISSLDTATDYSVALRYRRSGRYTSGYDGEPDTWPSASLSSFTTALTAPVLDSVVWSRTSGSSERVRVQFTPDDLGVKHQILRDNTVISTLNEGVKLFDDTGVSGESFHNYQVRAVIGQFESPASNTKGLWTGLSAPPSSPLFHSSGIPCTSDPDTMRSDITWVSANLAWETEVLVGYEESGVIVPAGQQSLSGFCVDTSDPQITIRHRFMSFGVYDYSTVNFVSEAA